MPKQKLLSRTKLQSFNRSELNALIQKQDGLSIKDLLQCHYHAEGSLEELIACIHGAFCKWRVCGEGYEDYLDYGGCDYNPYRWACILATYSDSLVFYTDSYVDGGPCYFVVNYDVVDGKVHIGTDVKAVEATIVVRALGPNGDGDLGAVQTVTGKTMHPSILQHISTKERNALADEDFAGPNRSFPIADQDDVDSASHLIGKADNPAAVKARIIAIAKRKGLTLPEAWTTKKKQETTMSNTSVNQDAMPVAMNLDEAAAMKLAAKKAKKLAKKQDSVPNTTEITDLAIANTPVAHSNSNPSLAKGKTDAETGGAAVTATGDPNSQPGVEHSDSLPAKSGNLADAGGVIIDPCEARAAGTQSAEHTPDKLIQSAHTDLAGNPMSYMVLQSTETATDGKKKMHLQGIVTRADIVNTEGQVYPLSVWQANLDKMNTLAQAGKFIGKLEHPAVEQGLQDAAIKFDKFWLQGSDLWADAVVVPTFPNGQNLQSLIEAGVQVDFSSRGYGTVKQEKHMGVQRDVIQSDFVCTAFDAVWHGASTGSGIKSIKYQSAKTTTDATAQTQGEKENAMPELTPAQADALAVNQAKELKDYRKALIEQCALSDDGIKAYKQALKTATTIDQMFVMKQSVLPALKAAFPAPAANVTQSSTYAPTFIIKQSKEELAPKSVGEMFDRMVQGADLPERYPGCDPSAPLTTFNSPRVACRTLLTHIAQSTDKGFHGLSAAKALLALEQGRVDRASDLVQASNLYQAFSTDSTIANANANNDGAPLSAPLIFPLVRRVFPRYIMNEVASIQPMDRPQGKIFYLDAYRTEDPAGYEKRIDLNTSANPFNPSYADNQTEGATAEMIRLRLTALTVTAYTKKIGAQWSIEEMQDLRAYHGLDAAQELMGSTAKEMAQEWNLVVLNDMLAQATAASLTYGTVAPASGFPNQIDWDSYIWNYITKLDSQIFSKRNNGMTHLICGVDAALALGKSFRGAFSMGNNPNQELEMYPGTTFFGTMGAPGGAQYKVFKTNFWTSGTTNGSKILGLRRGTEWSDTPYVFCPYTDYVTPQFTDPTDFSQRQGIMSRAAKQVVVSDAMGYITVNIGGQGAVI